MGKKSQKKPKNLLTEARDFSIIIFVKYNERADFFGRSEVLNPD
jgi:hypothetical protein